MIGLAQTASVMSDRTIAISSDSLHNAKTVTTGMPMSAHWSRKESEMEIEWAKRDNRADKNLVGASNCVVRQFCARILLRSSAHLFTRESTWEVFVSTGITLAIVPARKGSMKF